MNYEQASKSLVKEIDSLSLKIYDTILDDYSDASRAILEEMAKMWAMAKNIAPDDMLNFAIQYNRLDKLLAEIEKQYTYYSKLAGNKVADNSFLTINEAYYRNLYQVQFFTGAKNVSLEFAVINPYLVEASIYGTIDAWKEIQTKLFFDKWGNPINYYPQNGTLSQLLKQNAVSEVAQIRASVSSSLIRGVSYSDASKDIKKIIGEYTKTTQGIEANGAMYKSLRIARTEGNRNLNAGSYANTNYARSEGIQIKRQWLATLDGRTRDRHQELDGKYEDENGLWHIGSDSATYPLRFSEPQNSIECRCTVIDRIEGVPIEQRRGKDPATGKSKIFDWTTYPEWAKQNGLKQKNGGYYSPNKSKG